MTWPPVLCPYCRAVPGAPCRTASGKRAKTAHAARRTLALSAPGGYDRAQYDRSTYQEARP